MSSTQSTQQSSISATYRAKDANNVDIQKEIKKARACCVLDSGLKLLLILGMLLCLR